MDKESIDWPKFHKAQGTKRWGCRSLACLMALHQN